MSIQKKLFLTFLFSGLLLWCECASAKENNSYNLSQIETRSGFLVESFEIEGNSVFTREELESLLIPFVGKQITAGLLLEVGQTVTEYYGARGYSASFARVDDRRIKSGIIAIEIVEGKIENIDLEVRGYLREGYVRSRLERDLKRQVFNNRAISQSILTLQEVDENIERLDVTSDIQEQEGGVAVNLNVVAFATPAFVTRAIAANTVSPSLGEITAGVQLDARVLGNGDRLVGTYFGSEGTDSYNFQYSFPVNARDGKIFASVGLNTSGVVEDPFAFADIDTESENYSFGFVQPLINTPTQRLSIGLTGTLQQTIGTLEGERSQLFVGADSEGKLRVAAIRLPIEYFTRDIDDIFTVRSQLNVGLDALGATINDEGVPDGRFATWDTNMSYAKVFAPSTYFLARTQLQLASNSLSAFETIDLGGLNTVRGYRQNLLSADNGVFFSMEAGVPLYRNENRDITLQLVPFVDYAKGWNIADAPVETNNLFSVGAGLRFSWGEFLFLRVDYGIPLTNRNRRLGERSLQDDGFHFGVIVTPIRF